MTVVVQQGSRVRTMERKNTLENKLTSACFDLCWGIGLISTLSQMRKELGKDDIKETNRRTRQFGTRKYYTEMIDRALERTV
jgi:hypothetical protein